MNVQGYFRYNAQGAPWALSGQVPEMLDILGRTVPYNEELFHIQHDIEMSHQKFYKDLFIII